MRGSELGDKRTQLGCGRSSRHRKLGAAGDFDFNLEGTATGWFFLHTHDGSLGLLLEWSSAGPIAPLNYNDERRKRISTIPSEDFRLLCSEREFLSPPVFSRAQFTKSKNISRSF